MNLTLGKLNIRNQKTLILIIVAILITIFFGRKIWDSQKVKSNILKKRIQEYQNKIDLSKEINRLSKEFEKFRNVSWLTEESVAIMGKVNELATNHGVEIFTFDPGGLRDNNNYFTFLMSLNIGADYFSLTRFLSTIEELESLTKIVSLRVIPTGEGSLDEQGPKVRANLSIEAFILKK